VAVLQFAQFKKNLSIVALLLLLHLGNDVF